MISIQPRWAHVGGALIALLFSSLPASVYADPDLPTATQIMDDYVTATGGKAAYQKITSTVTTGTFSLPAQNLKGTFASQAKAPDKVLFTQTSARIGKTEEGFDGKTGWAKDPLNGQRVLSGVELTQIKEQAQFYGPPFFKSFHTKMEVVGVKMVNDVKTYAVRLTRAQGPSATQYFDEETKLLVRVDDISVSPQGSTPTETYFSDWKAVDGVKSPYTVRQVIAGNEMTLTTTSVKNNVAIPDSVFAPPSAPAQALKHAPQESAASRQEGLHSVPVVAGIYFFAAVSMSGMVSYDPYVLLKDGTIYKAVPPVPLKEWNVAQSRVEHPRDWGHWQRQSDGGLIVQWGSVGKPIKYKPGECPQATPAKSGEQLRGTYSAFSSSTMHTSANTSNLSVSRDINFSADGRFQEEHSASYSYSKTGGSGLTTGSQKAHSGTYTLSGYTLTRRYDDGRVVQSWYCRQTDESIYLGNTLYMQRRSTR